MKLYKLTYTQESEAFVSAESEEEAREYITELTENGAGDKMSWVRLNECGWEFVQDYGKLEELSEEEMQEDFYTHKTEDGSYWSEDGSRLYWGDE